MANAHDLSLALQLLSTSGSLDNAVSRSAFQTGESSGTTMLLKAWPLYGTDTIAPALTTAYKDLLKLSERQSLISQIRAVAPFKKTPFNTPVLGIASASAAGFVADGALIPTGSFTTERYTIDSKKVSTIVPLTKELLKAFDATYAVSGNLTRAVAEAESTAFVSTTAATPAAPAGILSGVSVATGTSNVATDVGNLVAAFDGDLSSSVLLTSPKSGAKLFGAGFDDSGVRGGTVAGLPHIAHRAVPDNTIILIDTSRIMVADEGELVIDQSENAVIQKVNANGAVDEAEDALNLFQQNLIALRVTRYINWLPADDSVAAVTSADW